MIGLLHIAKSASTVLYYSSADMVVCKGDRMTREAAVVLHHVLL